VQLGLYYLSFGDVALSKLHDPEVFFEVEYELQRILPVKIVRRDQNPGNPAYCNQ
jgi:hypothetical protein